MLQKASPSDSGVYVCSTVEVSQRIVLSIDPKPESSTTGKPKG